MTCTNGCTRDATGPGRPTCYEAVGTARQVPHVDAVDAVETAAAPPPADDQHRVLAHPFVLDVQTLAHGAADEWRPQFCWGGHREMIPGRVAAQMCAHRPSTSVSMPIRIPGM